MMPHTPDIFPTVIVDHSYGELVAEIDVDLPAVTAHLREKGMTDDEIVDLTITFSGVTSKQASDEPEELTLGRFKSDTNDIYIYKPQDIFAMTAPFSIENNKRLSVSNDTKASKGISSTLVHELEHFVASKDEDFKREVAAYLDKKQAEFLAKHVSKMWMGIGGTALLGLGVAIMGNVMTHQVGVGEAAAIPLINDGSIALGIGLPVAALFRFRRKLVKIYSNTKNEWYMNNPNEIRARLAEEQDQIPFVAVEAKSVRYDNMATMLEVALQKTGGNFEAIEEDAL